MTPTMTPAMLRDDRGVLLLLSLVLLSVLSVLSTDTGTVAFKSLEPVFPARSWYVPANTCWSVAEWNCWNYSCTGPSQV